MAVGKGSSSSKQFRYLSSRKTLKGRINVEKRLNPKGIRTFRANTFTLLQQKFAGDFTLLHVVILSKANEV
jgi:hypothetical protein